MPIEIVMWNQDGLVFCQNVRKYIEGKKLFPIYWIFFLGELVVGRGEYLVWKAFPSFLPPKAGAKSILADSDCAVL